MLRLERSDAPEEMRSLRGELVLERKPARRGEVGERTRALREGESLRLELLKELLLRSDELRLELLNELLRLEELLELLRLELLLNEL